MSGLPAALEVKTSNKLIRWPDDVAVAARILWGQPHDGKKPYGEAASWQRLCCAEFPFVFKYLSPDEQNFRLLIKCMDRIGIQP